MDILTQMTVIVSTCDAQLESSQPASRFTLVDNSPATLEVLDLQGRLVACQDLVEPTAGQHERALRVRLPAGVYFLRLRQAGREASGKSIIVR